MNTVKIYQLDNLSPTQFRRLRQAQMEAAHVWNCCMQTHKAARLSHARWPERNELQKATKGQFALHSQSVQMVVHAFLANIETTRQLRQTHPQMRDALSLQNEAVLSCFLARASRLQRAWTRRVANGQRAQSLGASA